MDTNSPEIQQKRQIITSEFVCKSIEKKMDDDGQEFGYFEGYASTFGNIDRSEDIIAKGAFEKSLLEGRKVKLCWQHDMRSPIGSFTEIKEDDHGLFVKGRINLGTSLGRDAYALLKAKDLDSMSIGFVTKKSTYDQKTKIRTIEEADLWEISIVTEPANTMATVTDVKSLDDVETLSDVEKVLRSKGFSRIDSKAVISKIKTISRCDAEKAEVTDASPKPDNSALLAELEAVKNLFTKP